MIEHWKGISATLGAIVLVASGVAQADELWHRFGWKTYSQVDAEITAAIDEIKGFRAEWKCDEWEEELEELLAQQQDGDRSIKTQERINKLRERIDESDCHRFE